MPTIERKEAAGYFALRGQVAEPIGDERPVRLEGGARGFAAAIGLPGRPLRPRRLEASSRAQAATRAQNFGRGAPAGTRIVLGEIVGTLDGETIFRGSDEWTVRRG